MKKYSSLFSAVIALFAFASCQQVIDTPNENGIELNKSVPFELVANIPETKTILDSETWQLTWDEGDVIYAVTTDEEWGKPYIDKTTTNIETIADFVYADGKFSTESLIAEGEHTFNFLYANESQKSFHRGKSTTHNLSATQSLDGENPTANLKNSDALAGTITANTPVTDIVNVKMNHLYTLMKVTLKNKSDKAIEVSSFKMKANGANLAGIFAVSFGNTPSASTQEGKTYGNSITVDITNGSIVAGGELPVYFVMAPLSSYSGDVTFSVIDSDGNEYSKTNKISSVSFTAGSYNTASFSFSTPDVKNYYTWNLSKASYDSASSTAVTWICDYATMTNETGTGTTAANNYLPETRTSSRMYKNNNLTISPTDGYAIDKVEFTATSESYATALKQSVWINAAAEIDEVDKNFVTVIPTNGKEDIKATISGTCGFTSVTVYFSAVEPDTTPRINVSSNTLNLDSEGKTEQTVTVSGNAYLSGSISASVSSDAQDWLDAVVEDGVLIVVANANDSVEERNATITLTADGAAPVEISVTQEGKEDGGQDSTSFVLTSDDIKAAHTTAWQYTSGEKIVLAADGSQWIANNTYSVKNQVTIQMNKGKGSYVLTPVVPSGKAIKHLVVTCSTSNTGETTTGVTRSFDITDASTGSAIATDIKGDNLTAGIDISGSHAQLKIAPNETNGGACYIVNITVQYN